MPVKTSKKSAIAEEQVQASSPNAIQFLTNHYAHHEGYISVVAISLEDGTIIAKSAATTDINDLMGFIAAFNGKRNLYFSVNPLRTKLSKKAEKTDVRCLAYLHVDIDPRDGYPLDEERQRIVALIGQFPATPTTVIDSGGGYQCFWQVKSPIPVNDNIAMLEGYNQRIAAWLGGDACWNVDRIMRLPGTWNLPTAKKKLQGRKKAVATVVRTSDSGYALDDFDFLPSDAAGAPSPSLPIEPEDIPDRFWELLKTDPRLKARWDGNSAGLKDTSRSGLDMSLAGMLWDRKFTKEEIAGILLSFEYGKAGESGVGSTYLSTTLSKLAEHSTEKGNAPLKSSVALPTLAPCIYWGEAIKSIPAAPVEHAVTPVFQMAAIHGLYADKGAGKTFWMLEGAVSMALGKKFLKWSVPKPRRVLYVDGEMGAAEMIDRLRLMTPNIPANLGLLSVDYLRSLDINVNIAQEKVRDAISAALKSYEDAGKKVEVLILDNLFSLAFGIDLKDAVAFDPIREWFLQLKAKGLCIILLDHENRAGGFFGTVSKIVNAAVILHLKKEGEGLMPGWTRLSVDVEYARSFSADQQRFACEFGTGKTLHGTAIVWDWDSKSNGGPPVPPHVTTLYHIHAASANKVEQIEQATGKARSTVQDHLSKLRSSGWLSKKGYAITPLGMATIKQHYPGFDLGVKM